jgi:hypothetical protein
MEEIQMKKITVTNMTTAIVAKVRPFAAQTLAKVSSKAFWMNVVKRLEMYCEQAVHLVIRLINSAIRTAVDLAVIAIAIELFYDKGYIDFNLVDVSVFVKEIFNNFVGIGIDLLNKYKELLEGMINIITFK